MKVINFAVAAAAILVFPVLFCSCNSGSAKKDTKAEVQAPKTAAAEDPKPVEITSESSFAAESPAKPEAADVPAKPEPVKAAKAEPAKPESAEVPAKPEAAKAEAVEVPAKAEPAKAAAKAEPAKAEAARAELPCEHTVRTGDNLWKISRQYYGSGNGWKKIYEANKSQIRKPEFLEPGTVLKIPAK